MLQQLLKYAEKKNLDVEIGFKHKKVKWLIECTMEGRFTGIVPIGISEDKKGKNKHSGESCKCPATPNMNQPGKSHFLRESLQTLCCYFSSDKTDQKKCKKKHQFFLGLLENCYNDTNLAKIETIKNLLVSEENIAVIHEALKEKKIKDTDIATFSIEGKNILKNSCWYDWWRKYIAQHESSSTKNKMRCLLTGELVEPCKTHENKIEGLVAVGGLGSGDALVCCDKSAFKSYKLDKSLNAATSEQSAWKYTETLNHLIKSRNNSIRSLNNQIIYWYKQTIQHENDPMAWLEGNSEQGDEAKAIEQIQELLQAIKNGECQNNNEDNHYYILFLSGASGRVMVRNYIEGPTTELYTNIAKWFSDQEIVDYEGKRRWFKFYNLIGTLRGKENIDSFHNRVNWLCAKLRLAALTGIALPYSLLPFVLKRVQSIILDSDNKTKNFPDALMALLKIYYCRNGGKYMNDEINKNCEQPAAYHCGRLLAVLGKLQYKALGDVGAGVVQRYYCSFSQMPALTLGRIISNAKNHLNKLEGGLVSWYEQQIADIMQKIGTSLPNTFDLTEQGLFALGYYHQLAKKHHTEEQNN